MKKKWISSIISVVALVFLYLCLQFFYLSPSWQKVINRCIDYNPQWLDMRDCYGVISISIGDNGKYDLQNTTEPGPIIAQIKVADDFFVKGNEMYLIDITPKGMCNNLMPGKYCGDFQVKGEPKAYYYDSPDQVPRYLIIDSKTGDEQFYVRPQDASSTDEAIFQALIKKENTKTLGDYFVDAIEFYFAFLGRITQ